MRRARRHWCLHCMYATNDARRFDRHRCGFRRRLWERRIIRRKMAAD